MEAQLTQLTQLVQSLHEKLDGVIEENKHLRSLLEKNTTAPPKKKSSREERQQCCGLTAKGTQCKNKAINDGRCKMHLNQNEEQPGTSQPKQKKKKKQKALAPTHTHMPGEVPTVYCRLCETHGDILDPTLPYRKFVVTSETVIEPEPLQEEPVQEEPVQEDETVPVCSPRNTLQLEEDEGDQDLITQLRNLTVQKTNWADVDDDDFFETS